MISTGDASDRPVPPPQALDSDRILLEFPTIYLLFLPDYTLVSSLASPLISFSLASFPFQSNITISKEGQFATAPLDQSLINKSLV
jgi:hypothetical protein